MGAWGRRTAVVVALWIGAFSAHIANAQSARSPSQDPDRVVVHIESPGSVDLERETGDRRDPFWVMCTSPCDARVPASGGYRIGGSGTRASRRFELSTSSGRETLVVSPASSAAFGIGIGLIVIGAAAIVIGGLAFVWAPFGENPNGPSGPPYLALGAIGGGLLAEGGGIALVVLNASSRVDQTSMLGAPVPGYPRPASWPLLRLSF
jgi:hypothetical protein